MNRIPVVGVYIITVHPTVSAEENGGYISACTVNLFSSTTVSWKVDINMCTLRMHFVLFSGWNRYHSE